jgi:hypothetical protein
MMVLILTNYILVIMNVTDASCFKLNSWTSIIVIGLSALFCIFSKADLYIKEDIRHE